VQVVDPDLLDETLRLHTRNHEPSTSVPQPGSLFCKSPKRPTKARVRPPLSIPTPSRTSTLYARTVQPSTLPTDPLDEPHGCRS